MSRKDVKRLNKEAKRGRKGHKLSAIAIYKQSQQKRRSLY